jgi:hypothetical protein
MLGKGTAVEARLGRRTSNALELVFRDGPEEPLATAVQGAGDSKKGKLGALLGFKNGGVGTHSLVASDGRGLWVESVSGAPTVVRSDERAIVGKLERGDEQSFARDADGVPRITVTGDPAGVHSLDAFRLLLHDDGGRPLGRLGIARTQAAWSLFRDVESEFIWWGKAAPLKLPLLGASVALDAPVDDVTSDLLAAICVDICIGLRPYVADMR